MWYTYGAVKNSSVFDYARKASGFVPASAGEDDAG